MYVSYPVSGIAAKKDQALSSFSNKLTSGRHHYALPGHTKVFANKPSSEFIPVFWPASYKDTHYLNIFVISHNQPGKRQSNSSQTTQLASADQETMSSLLTLPQTSNCQVSTAVLH